QLLQQMRPTWEQYRKDVRRMIALSMSRQNEAAFRISVNEGAEARDLVVEVLEQIIRESEASMNKDVVISNSDYSTSLQSILAVIAASILIAILVSYWIIRSITNRIAFIATEGEKIASRETYTAIP